MNYFIFDKQAKSPHTHLAINKYCASLVNENKAKCIVRFYYHQNAVILANAESIEDVNLKNAEELEFDVLRRPSGGSVIVATPQDMLCYSVFLPTSLFEKKSASHYYKRFTLPLAKKLGHNFEIAGAYYLRYKKQPIAGHAMKTEKNYIQIDGLIHTKKPDIDLISRLIHLRELYEYDEEKIIKMNNKFFKGNQEIKINNPSLLNKIASEIDLIEQFPGLNSTQYSPEEYAQKLKETLEEIIGNNLWKNKLKLDFNEVQKNLEYLRNELNQTRHQIAQGHCFVDFSEPEPEIKELDEIYNN